MTSYSYSLDRQVWIGHFVSRKEASQAGIAQALKESTPPETVYVAQRITPDLRAYGHARTLIETMRRRVREDNGDIADGYLRNLSDKQITDLDRALESTIVDWLNRSDLAPNWVRIEAVGQYPLPTTVATGHTAFANDREVSDLGIEEPDRS